MDWIGLSLFIKARIVLTPGGSSTLGEVNLVAFYTTSPNNRRLVSSTLCTHAVPRPICAGGLQSLLFRHDFAFVVLYLSLLFMGHKDTIGPRRCSGKTQAHRDKFVGNREISNCEVNEVRWMILKRSRNITVHVLIAESKVLTLIGVGTFCARSISGCSSQLTFPVPRSFTRQFACESIVNPGHEWTRCANTDTQLQTR